MVRGRHTIKFGTDIRREALDIVNPANPTGSYAFTTTGTNSSDGRGRQRAGVAAAGAGERFQHRYSEPGAAGRARTSRSFSWATTGRFPTG